MITVKKMNLPAYHPNDPLWLQFFQIFRSTLNPDMSQRIFHAYFFSGKPRSIDVSFIYENEELIGFIEASFYHVTLSGKKYTIGRGAAGLLKGSSGGKLPSFELCKKYMHYKWANPTEKIYIIGYMANPILYAMICNYTHRVFPKAGIKETREIRDFRESLLHSNNLAVNRKGDYLVRLHFPVDIGDDLRARIEACREDKNIGFYLAINPDYGGQYGVITIIPLDWMNITASIWKGLVKRRRLKNRKHTYSKS